MKRNASFARLRTAASSAVPANAEFPRAIQSALFENFPITTGYRPDSDRIISRTNPSLTSVISETYDFFYRNPHPKNSILTPGLPNRDPRSLVARPCHIAIGPLPCFTDGGPPVIVVKLEFFLRQLRILSATISILFFGAIATNGAESTNAIHHSPLQPKSGQAVTVSATLPQFESATLQLQAVLPGSYVRRTDRTFKTDWQDLPMEKHGDSFIASVPGSFQKHRSLLRYRIKGISGAAKAPVLIPAETNAVPNFAWFVYDGLPEWKGSSRPGQPPELTFSSEFLSTLPTYHLIANGEDVKDSQWDGNANRKPFLGTLVYDGKVYDHITYNNRGQASTYVAGKNKWGVKFNAGEQFLARNNYGVPYRFAWSGFNMNPCASAWAPVNRGMAGMDEALSYRAYQLCGVPSPDTFWIHFRVIDAPSESSKNQYHGDLWGLYLIVQEKNGTWLREQNLPDGDIFSIDSGPKHIAKKPQGSRPPRAVHWPNGAASEDWWRAHLDLPAYYGFHALNRFLANIDLRPEGNHYLYHRPDGRIVVLPHDLDMMLIPKSHQPGFVAQASCLDQPALKLKYQARAREILDLFASDPAPNGGQIGQLVAELSSQLRPRGHQRNWAELDEAMWNWHPRSHHKGQFYVTPYDDHRMGGQWVRTLDTPDFNGFCKYILEFCTDSRPKKNFRPNDGNQLGYGYGYLALEAKDKNIPATPEIHYKGPKNFPKEQLAFKANVSGKPARIEWRIAQISAPGVKGYVPGKPCRYEIETLWKSEELPGDTREIQVPASVCAAERSYRVRARVKDDAGRVSHWSAPLQCVTSR
jgi:hypothetical protein